MGTTLITGSGSGIGRATALALARAGHRVLATMRNPLDSELRSIAERERLAIEIHKLDVDSDASVEACFRAIREPIDVLVNNAGIGPHGSVEELPMSVFAAALNTNYLGAVRCIKAVLPRMREARAGCIVNISSVSGRIASPAFGAYVASKFALESISEVLAGEVKSFNIRVAIVAPGIQDTKLARGLLETVPSLYPHDRRWANYFRAALAYPANPDTTATVVRQIIESGTWKLRHAAGQDAELFLAWRAGLTDEQWVDWNARDDDSWYNGVLAEFGLDCRPTRGARGGE